MKTALLLCITLAAANVASAQTPPAQTPPPSSTSPSAASSPHQRESTTTPAKETPAQNTSSPAAAATPHQKEVTEGAGKTKGEHEKMMKDCVAKQQATNSSLSKDDAKKACTDQMKSKSHQQPN